MPGTRSSITEYAGSGHHDPTGILWLVVALVLAERLPVRSAPRRVRLGAREARRVRGTAVSYWRIVERHRTAAWP
jgi:hypothetical protein